MCFNEQNKGQERLGRLNVMYHSSAIQDQEMNTEYKTLVYLCLHQTSLFSTIEFVQGVTTPHPPQLPE